MKARIRDDSLELTKIIWDLCLLNTLHCEFGFGEKRCQRFRTGLDRAADYINDGLAEWVDYVQSIKDELNIELVEPGKRYGS